MELKDLNRTEKMACIALLNVMVITDGASSPEEAKHAAHLAEAFGKDEFLGLVDETNNLVQTKQDLTTLVAEVTDQETRELIFGEILECASEDGIFDGEASWLEWLAEQWEIHVEYEIIDEDEPAEE